MAINVNIDNQLALEYSFLIAGKKRDLTFDDECALELERVRLKVGKILQKVDSLDDESLDKKSVNDQLKYFDKAYADIRNAIIPFFDKYFGDGTGLEIYKFNHESTRALATVFGKVSDYLDKLEIKNSKADGYKKSGD